MNKLGQSMIEYALIAVLVVLGLVIMGPYVLRSVGAHYKLWDDSVQDSISENLTQAPISDVPHMPTNCACQDISQGCGDSSASSQCGANQRIYAHNCNPQLCDGAPSSYCQDDTACCTTLTATGCGNAPLGQPAPPYNCHYGFRIYTQQCGSINKVLCQRDDTCPQPECLGILAPGVVACPGSPGTPGGAKINQNYGITYVSEPSQAACGGIANCSFCDGITCQYYCDNSQGYFINASGTSCTDRFTVAPGISSCGTPSACTQNLTPYTRFSCSDVYDGGGYTTTFNNCSFEICAPTAQIKTITLTDISQPQVPPYCNNPGNPGEQCQVAVTY